jgi:hypothetical protein
MNSKSENVKFVMTTDLTILQIQMKYFSVTKNYEDGGANPSSLRPTN